MAGSLLGSLSSQQALALANIYLENALNANDPDISLILCHDTKVSLSQAKETVKGTENSTATDGIAAAYVDLGNLLNKLGHESEAQESYKKAEGLGRNAQEPTLLAKFLQTVGSAQLKDTPHYASSFCPSNSELSPLSTQYKKNRMYNWFDVAQS
ncbi:MAG: hypothetical protein J3Q66DRAFT_373112 [Benniella sp.]|nr:MAG: hypothetical protein J3Q66DRAFT_373112 [Benniella sp.]